METQFDSIMHIQRLRPKVHRFVMCFFDHPTVLADQQIRIECEGIRYQVVAHVPFQQKLEPNALQITEEPHSAPTSLVIKQENKEEFAASTLVRNQYTFEHARGHDHHFLFRII